MTLTEKIDKRLQWYEATANAEDADVLLTVRQAFGFHSYSTESEIIRHLRHIFDTTQNAYVMCVVSNIAENMFGVHFPRVEQSLHYRPKNICRTDA